MGGKIEEIIPERGCFFIRLGKEKIFVSRKFQISNDLFSGNSLTTHKDLTYVILKENNISVPKSTCFYKKSFNESNLNTRLRALKYPIVIKDADGSNSKGVFIDIKNIRDAKKIILREIKKFPALVAQEMIHGKEYRVLILENKSIGALEMIPPRIFGNGKSTVKELIVKKQADKFNKTRFDQALRSTLKKQKYNLDSIPSKGSEVFIKNSSCVAEGGETKDVTDLLSPAIEKICVGAAKITGKYLAGIDLICEDISKSPQEQEFSIIEINGKPDLYIHHNPNHGKKRNVTKAILKFILRLKRK